MADILTRAGCFVAIMVLGFALRKAGFFKEGDFRVLSKITLQITLSAAVVVGFSQVTMDMSMLFIPLLGFGGGIIYMAAGWLINLTKPKEQKAFAVLNLSSYNIGLFAMPFVQSFLGPVGVVCASLFDSGNAIVCLGGSYGVASSIKAGQGLSFRRIGRALLRSAPFMCYMIMLALNALKIQLPKPVLSFAEIIKNANIFMGMLMIGVGIRLPNQRAQIGKVLQMVALRYAIAAVIAACFYFLLPFNAQIRTTLVILAFCPIGSSIPAFTAELKEDVGLSSAINSICILCSTVLMVALLGVLT